MRAQICLGAMGLAARLVAAVVVLPAATALAPPLPVLDASAVAATLWRQRELWATDVHGLVRCGGEGEPRFRLAYMPIRNRAESVRLMLADAACAYDFEVVGFKNWAAGVKATTPHGKLPVLRDFDGAGTDLGQEQAIARHVARELGFFGATPVEAAAVDETYSLWFALLRNQGVSHDGEHFSVAALKAAAPTADRPAYREIFRLNDLSRAERSLAALGFFEDALARSDFLVGATPTLPDFGLFYCLYELAEEDNVPDFAAKFALPRLGAFVDRMAARPGIAAFLASPARMPRYARDASTGAGTYEYVAGRGSPARHVR